MKCQNAAFRLQRECYDRLPHPKRHFNPCPKGLIYTAECASGNGRAMSELWGLVTMTPCACHADFTAADCIEYENDPHFNPYTQGVSS